MQAQVTLSKWSFLQPWWLNFPQWSIYTSYSLLWLILYGDKPVNIFFLLGNVVCSVPEMKGLAGTFVVMIFLAFWRLLWFWVHEWRRFPCIFQCSCCCFLGKWETIGCVLPGIQQKNRQRWEAKADYWWKCDRFKTKRHSAHSLFLWSSSDMQITLAPTLTHHWVSREGCLQFALLCFCSQQQNIDRAEGHCVMLTNGMNLVDLILGLLVLTVSLQYL